MNQREQAYTVNSDVTYSVHSDLLEIAIFIIDINYIIVYNDRVHCTFD